jgi:hypothetical protein
LTSYWGSFVPVLTVDPLTNKHPDAAVTARIVPATGFGDLWFASGTKMGTKKRWQAVEEQ